MLFSREILWHLRFDLKLFETSLVTSGGTRRGARSRPGA